MTDRLIRLTTAPTVLMVAGVAAIISYELVTSLGEAGFTEHLLPFTVYGPDLGREQQDDGQQGAALT